MIPKSLHFVRLAAPPEEGGKPWTLTHHVCLKSAIERTAPDEARIYVDREPGGPWWELSRPLADVVQVEAPTEVLGRPLHHIAHKADVIRLRKLIEHGGIYLDLDALTVRDFSPLLDHRCVLGQLGEGGQFGIANGVILAERETPFLTRWMATYDSFRSKGRDEFWDEHSVRTPQRLAREHPDELTILDHKAFFWPLWFPRDLHSMFGSDRSLDAPEAYAHHLWETRAWDAYIDDLSVRRLRRSSSNFARLALPYLEDVPDDFAEPTSAQVRRASAQRALMALRRVYRAARGRP